MPKLPGIGATGVAETGTTSAAGIGATGVAGAVIPTPAAISDPSVVFASGEISMQMKRKCKKEIRGRKIHTYEVRLGRSTPLFIRIGNSLF